MPDTRRNPTADATSNPPLTGSASTPECGTHAGYWRHRAAGEPIDDACRATHRSRERTYEARRRARRAMGACDACGLWRPIVRHGWCQACVSRWYRAGRPTAGPPQLDPERAYRNRVAGARIGTAAIHLYKAIRDGGWDWVLDAQKETRWLTRSS